MKEQLQKDAEQQGYASSGIFLFKDFFNREYGKLAEEIHNQIVATPRDKMWTEEEIILLWVQSFNSRVVARVEAQAEKEMQRAAASTLNDNDKIDKMH